MTPATRSSICADLQALGLASGDAVLTHAALRQLGPVLGARAAWFTADHPLDYGYGPGSPLAKLVEAGGKCLMLGAPLDTMTLLHHAEHIADFPDKRIKRGEAPMLVDGRKVWRTYEEFDTGDPPEGLPDDYFATIVRDYLATGSGRTGKVAGADCVLVEAAPMVDFARAWMERSIGRG